VAVAGWAIVTVAWRSADDLARLVDSMNEHLPAKGVRPTLVVVDNEPDPATRSAGERWAGPTLHIDNPGNPGFGAAANRGVAEVDAAAIVIINPDCRLVDSSLADLARAAERRDCIAAPGVLGEDGSVQANASGPVGGAWPWLGAVWPGALQPGAVRARTEPWRLPHSVRVGWVAGMCLAGRRDTLLSLGPFDPAIHMYGEDLDLGLRAGAVGIESWFMPDVARIVHGGRGSASQRWRDGPELEIARTRRAVVRRALGARAERWDRRAQLVNLRLRALAKRALRRDSEREERHLRAALSADPVELPAPPARPRRTRVG
jgi:N-acetylglucosaminyl-diphospho-decaprenol L-rhamnosyltransferase